MHNGKYSCHMAASCTYHLPSASYSKRAIQKSLTLTVLAKNILEFSAIKPLKVRRTLTLTLSTKMTRQTDQNV